MTSFTPEERRLLRTLKTPERIQLFLDEEVGYNKEPHGETCGSPRRVLNERAAHCFEGALMAAAAMRFHGRPPLVLQLRAERDDDHVLALFRERPDGGAWGAVAKSNFAGLRFRAPVYRSLRELAMSYFEQYYNLRAEKSLRSYCRPVNLSRFDARGWETADEELWDVSDHLATRDFLPLVSGAQIRQLGLLDRRLYEAGLHGSVGIKPLRYRTRSRGRAAS
jgi:hypothetical protein